MNEVKFSQAGVGTFREFVEMEVPSPGAPGSPFNAVFVPRSTEVNDRNIKVLPALGLIGNPPR